MSWDKEYQEIPSWEYSGLLHRKLRHIRICYWNRSKFTVLSWRPWIECHLAWQFPSVFTLNSLFLAKVIKTPRNLIPRVLSYRSLRTESEKTWSRRRHWGRVWTLCKKKKKKRRSLSFCQLSVNFWYRILSCCPYYWVVHYFEESARPARVLLNQFIEIRELTKISVRSH